MFEAYKPKGVKLLDKNFVDKGVVPSWVAMDAWVAAVCYKTVEAAKNNLSTGCFRVSRYRFACPRYWISKSVCSSTR